MNDLNNVPSTGTFGNSINQVNQNFGLVKGAIENVEGRTIRSKGLFPTQAALTAAYPSPKVGDYAYVGSGLPATIYDCLVEGTWHNTGQTGGSETVDLNNYSTKSETSTSVANSLAQATARTGYGEATASNNAYSVTITGYTLPTNGGVVRVKMPTAATGAATLNITDTGAKTIWYNGLAVTSENTWGAGEVISVFYDGTKYMASNSQGGGGNASKIRYDNSLSGLAAENIQEAVDEVAKDCFLVAKQFLINPTIVDTSTFTKNVKYINSSNEWQLATQANQAKSMNIPVVGGEVYMLESNSTNGAIYALLKSNTSVGNPVDFSNALNHRVVLNPNEKVIIEIPNDTTILYLFAETNSLNFLPQSLMKGIKIQEIVSDVDKNVDNKNISIPNMLALEQIYKDETIDTSTFTKNVKYINSSNKWQLATTENYAKSINIPVNGGEVYALESNSTNGAIYALLKSNTSVGNPVDFSNSLNHRVVLNAMERAVIEIPSDTTILYLFAETNNLSFLPSSLTKLSKTNQPSYKLGLLTPRFVYKRGVMMGDSITAGVYSYFNNSERWNGVQVGSGISDYIEEIIKCHIDNVGKRGTGYVADTRNIDNAWELAQITDYSQYDLCVMMYGVNDYIQGMPLGSIEDNIEGTIAGNMIRVFNKIFTDNPLCKVLCVGSYNTWGQVSQGGDYTSNVYYGDESTDYGLGYAINGNTLRDVLNLQKQVCEHFHIQYFCLADEGIVNTFNIKNVLVDGLHPTLELRKYIAQEIAKYLV